MSMNRKCVPPKEARVMIVDDHPTVREGLAFRVGAQPDMMVCGEASDVGEALQKVRDFNPDVMIVDIALKNSDGLELIKCIRSQHSGIRTVVHSMYDENIYADRCLRAGAMGYVNKEDDPNEVISAIRDVLAGYVHLSAAMTRQVLGRSVHGRESECDPVKTLTDRQLEVFRLIGKGRTASQIAADLYISVHTVETHRENIKRKLNAHTVSELTRHAVLWTAENQ